MQVLENNMNVICYYVQCRIQKALVEANSTIRVGGYPLLECWKDMRAFHLLDDTIEYFIKNELTKEASTMVNISMTVSKNSKCIISPFRNIQLNLRKQG